MPAMSRLINTGVAALSVLAAFVDAHKHGHAHHHAEKRQAATYPIIGAGSTVQPRLEIRQLEANTDAWNLFMLAMADFTLNSDDHSQQLSFFQTAGIHGAPYVEWDGAPSYSNPPAPNGYCTHTSPIFPAWHRPYVVLIEQLMVQHATTIANQFTGADQARYLGVLPNLRLPYYDWAELPPDGNSADSLPDSISNATVTVNTPSGPQTIPNPLYAYTNFQPPNAGIPSYEPDFPYGTWSDTYRWPTNINDQGADDDEAGAINALGSNNPSNRQQVYNILTQCTDFLDIGNDGTAGSDNPNCPNSLEGLHNGIHADFGGSSGQMSYNDFAAFDPVFFLHHSNVDRLFAIWQNLHADSWMPSTTSGSASSFAIGPNTPLDGNTVLSPFHKDAVGTFWTVNDIRDWTVFQYTYPEFVNGQDLMSQVNNLYGSNPVPQSISSSPASVQQQQTSASPLSLPTSAASLPTSSPSLGLSSGSSSTSGSANGLLGGSSSSGSGSMSLPTGLTGSMPNLPGLNIPTTGPALPTGSGIGLTFSTPAIPTGLGIPPAPTGGSNSGNQGSGSGPINVPGCGFPQPGSSLAPAPVASFMASMTSAIGAEASSVAGALGGLLSGTGNGNPASLLTPFGKTQDYQATILVEKHGLGGTFKILMFLTQDASSLPTTLSALYKSPAFVGSAGIFAPLSVAPSTGMLVKNAVSLTQALVGKIVSGELASLNQADVLPFLQKELVWVVVAANGNVVPNDQVPGLAVGCTSANLIPATSLSTFASVSNYTLHNEVTNGKVSGIQNGQPYDWYNTCS